MNQTETKEYLTINLVGKDPLLFQRLFDRLSDAVETAIATLTKDDLSDETKQTIQDVSAVLRDFVEAKITRPSIENQKILSEIASQYAEVQERLASARKLRAEAKSLEIDNTVKKLQSCLQMLKLVREIASARDPDSLSVLLR